MPSTISDRFTGTDGRRRLAESIRTQRIVGNSEEIAGKIVSAGTIEIVGSGDVLMQQSDATNDIFFSWLEAFQFRSMAEKSILACPVNT